jgi:ubiquitin-protein ligase
MVEPESESLYERRMHAEWNLLQQLAARNPDRLTDLSLDDGTIVLRLKKTPALLIDGSVHYEHVISLGFPMHYPAVPMTLHLQEPVLHPNVHPSSGFVCLWADHRITNTVEHALHKTVAILGWRLFNAETVHVMQPAALLRVADAGSAEQLHPYTPLLGVDGRAEEPIMPAVRRGRLS